MLQELGEGPNGHISVAQNFNVSAALNPIKQLLINSGLSESTVDVEYTYSYNPKSYVLHSYKFDGEAMTDAVKDYLVNYYGKLDGVAYADLNDYVQSKKIQKKISYEIHGNLFCFKLASGNLHNGKRKFSTCPRPIIYCQNIVFLL